MKKFFVASFLFFMFFALPAAEHTGRLFVKLDAKCLSQGREACIKSLGCTEAGELTLKNWALLKCGNDEPVKKAAAFVKKGMAAHAERFVRHQLYSVDSIDPLYLNDTYLKEQWNFHNTGNTTFADGKATVSGKDHAHIAEAWRLLRILGAVSSDSELGKDRKLAIIDDGFDILHEDIQPGIIASNNFGDNTIEAGNLFSNQSATKNFHGTFVTGIAGGRGNNSLGVAGACPACSLILARMAGDPEDVGAVYESYYDQVFRWVVQQGAEVVNNSWGLLYENMDDCNYMKSYYNELFDYMTTEANGGKGVLLVFASGNAGADFSTDPFSTHPNVLAVGAVNSKGSRYSFSNYGPRLGVMAPTSGGEKSGSKFVDRIWTTDNYIAPTCSTPGTSGCHDKAGWNPDHVMAGGDGWWGKYSYRFSHTSSAAPLVSGVAAIVLEANPDLTAVELRDIIVNTADRVSKTDANYDSNGHSNYYGFGRVNALRAVAAAWIKGGGTITADIKDAIDKASPCTREDCWDFEGAEYPDADLYDYDPVTPDEDYSEDADEKPDKDNDQDSDHDSGNQGGSDIDNGGPENNDSDPGTEPDDTPAGPLCGNGNIDANEICDGNTMPCAQLAGAPKNGTAKCASNCMGWDKSGCYNDGEEPPASDTDEPVADNGEEGGEDHNSDPSDAEDDDSGCALLTVD